MIACPEFFPAVAALLDNQSSRKLLRKEAAWTISNISAGTPAQIASVLNAHHRLGLLDKINWALLHSDFEVQRECVWLYWNIFSGGTLEQKNEAVRAHALPTLVKFMAVCQDTKTLINCIDTIDGFLHAGRILPEYLRTGDNPHCRVFEECGGLDLYESLQDHTHVTVFQKVQTFLRTHFASPESSGAETNLNVFDSNPQMGQQLRF